MLFPRNKQNYRLRVITNNLLTLSKYWKSLKEKWSVRFYGVFKFAEQCIKPCQTAMMQRFVEINKAKVC